MKNSIRKRKQKLVRKVSKATAKAGEQSKEHLKHNLIDRISHIENIRLLIAEWGLMVFALIMLAVTQAFWFADSYAEDRFDEGGAFSEGTLGTVSTLNPLFATTSSEKALSRLLFATLATNDYSGHPGAGLAESIRSSENGRVWTVKLREGLKWSDGEPSTNEDVIFSVNTIKNPVVKSIYDTSLVGVEASENEEGEVVLTLPQPYADFVAALNFPVLPKHKLENADLKNLVEDSFSTEPVTSGPFRFNALQATSGKDERVYYLTANPDYYKGKPNIASFAIHTYPKREDLVAALNLGEVTATAELTDNESELVTSAQLLKQNVAENVGVYLFFNTKSENLSNREMRQAIRQGLDLEAVREVAADTTPLDYPLLSTQIELENYPKIPEYDFKAAKTKIAELIGAAGTADSESGDGSGRPILEIATVNTGYAPDVANQVASQLQDLGFQTNISIYDENQQDFLANRSYDILIYKIGLGADPDLLPYYHSSQAGNGLNLSNYQNTLTDELILGARNTVDANLRAKKYESFLERWVEDVPAIGLYQANLTYFYNKNAQTFGNNVRLVTAVDRFTDVDEWAVNKTSKYRTP